MPKQSKIAMETRTYEFKASFLEMIININELYNNV